MTEKIKCLSAINLSTNQFLFLFAAKNSNTQFFKNEIQILLTTLHQLRTSNKEISKIHSENGTWVCLIDFNKSVVFLALVSILYPTESVIRLLTEMKNETLKEKNYEFSDLNPILKNQAISLMENYEKDENYNDKVLKLEQNFASINLKMKDNITHIIKNKDELEKLEGKTENLSSMAQQFKNTSTDLKKEMLCKKYLTWVIIGAIFIGLLAGIIVIAVEAQED